jgi:hypothetical protein
MTSPYVTFPHPHPHPHPPAPAARPSAWPVLRVILSVALVLAGGFGFVIAGFIAIVTWSGCFIECTGTNHRAGAALALLAVALLAAGPALVAALYRSRTWMVVAGFAGATGTVLMLLGVSSN